jgi:eukaryotic-like serine/threonine-protein kinase
MPRSHNRTASDAGSSSTVSGSSGWLDDVWATRQVEAMAAAWERGERISAAQVLEQFPDVDEESAIRVIYEEVCLRREAGLDVETAEILDRYPRWRQEIQDLLECDRLLGPSGKIAACPEVGEDLGSFRLLAELGRGASGRTYLATDPRLADRPVVLKVIPGDQDEHLALAQLRHTHIVPLFSEHSFPDMGLRVLCMPYLGGASLERILSDLEELPPAKRSGRLLVDLIDRNTRQAPSSPRSESPFRRALELATYPQAVAWIAACLADGLQYAHERRLVHMDVKPSNVLITVDGQPMLLDFHLARAPFSAGAWVVDRLGGTPGWMSPEQKSAMKEVNDGRPAATAVDGRTDIFALGLLMRAALSAPSAIERSTDFVSEKCSFAGVSVGLGDIVRKCTAQNPADRYQDAGRLAADLRRHLQDLPLRGVGNRDPIERWRKWRRRSPSALAWGIAALAVVVASTAAWAVHTSNQRQQVAKIEVALQEGRRLNEDGRYAEAIQAFESGVRSAGNLASHWDLRRSLDRELQLAHRRRQAGELHALADQIRFRYSIDLPPDGEARTLLDHCSAVLNQKNRLVGKDRPAVDDDAERQIQSDLLELAAVWADLRVRVGGSSDLDLARREALLVLNRTSDGFGPSLAIELRRQELLGASRAATAAGARAPRTAWEHYDKGRHDLRTGQFAAAAVEFRQALDLRPQDFWSNFHQGLCAFRLGHFHEAAGAFQACCALEPRSAVCRYNRALVDEALGQTDQAFDGYSQAVDLDPTMAPALLNRGILSYRGDRLADAVRDFDSALALRLTDQGVRGRLHFNLALALFAQGHRAGALENAELGAREGSSEAVTFRDDLRSNRAFSRRRPFEKSHAAAGNH